MNTKSLPSHSQVEKPQITWGKYAAFGSILMAMKLYDNKARIANSAVGSTVYGPKHSMS